MTGRHTRHIVLALLAIVAVLTPVFAQQQFERNPLSTSQIADLVTPSAVTITGVNSTGSGVVIGANGLLVTNLHVVEGETELSVELANGDIYDDVSVVDFDKRRDLLLLKIKAFNLTPAAFGDSDVVQVGDDVVLIGNPEDVGLTVSEGVISRVANLDSGYRMFQTSAPASSGSSGGGMFNAYGELIGIVTSQIPDGQNLNFAVPINYARGLTVSDDTMTLENLADQLDLAVFEASNSNLAELAGLSMFAFEESETVDGLWFSSMEGIENLDSILISVEVIDGPFGDLAFFMDGLFPMVS